MKLEIGYNNNFEVRKEFYSADVNGFTMLYLSDLHFNGYTQAKTIANLVNAIQELNPDIILLGGDYADTKKGMVHFCNLLKAIGTRKNVFAIAGNHDYYFGIAAVEKLVTGNNVTWLEKKSAIIKVKDTSIRIDGIKPVAQNNDADISILCLHKPIAIKGFAENYAIAFAGHLHGCQFVFWQNNKGLYPGRLFFKQNTLKQQFKNCNYYISKGLGDVLPMRFNCKKDMIFVTVGKNPDL